MKEKGCYKVNKSLQEKLPVASKAVWRIYSAIQVAILIAAYIVAVYFTRNIEIPTYLFVLIAIVLLIYSVIIYWLVPKIRWEILSYEVREHEIELQTGLFIVKRSIIPIIRVQHVDVKSGPIIKRKNLASIDITTAATTHTIPLLAEHESDRLRLKISELARMAKEDV